MYFVPLPSKREQAFRSRRSQGLGQAYDAAPSSYSHENAFITFRFVDKNDRVIPYKKFYFDVLTDLLKDGTWNHHFSNTSDGNGLVRLGFSLAPGADLQRYFSITPLFENPYALKDRAIVWQAPWTMSRDPAMRPLVTITLMPGGGLTKQEAPKPAPLPAPVPGAPAMPSAQGKKMEEFQWGPVLVGGLAFMASLYFITRFMGKGE